MGALHVGLAHVGLDSGALTQDDQHGQHGQRGQHGQDGQDGQDDRDGWGRQRGVQDGPDDVQFHAQDLRIASV